MTYYTPVHLMKCVQNDVTSIIGGQGINRHCVISRTYVIRYLITYQLA